MSTRRRPDPPRPDQAILGDELAAELRADIDTVRSLVQDLARQVQAQFTTISAHAEIARQQAEFAREEARADLERTRSMMIDLLGHTRQELLAHASVHVPGTSPGGSFEALSERLDSIESRVADLLGSLNRCFERQRVLAETVEALFDTVIAVDRNEPVAGLSLV